MRRLLVAALASALAACSSEETKTPTPDPVEKPSIEALYDTAPAAWLTPYPSDRYTVADAKTKTGRRVHIGSGVTSDPLVLMYPLVADELNEMDGFSTAGGVILSFSGPIDIHGIVEDELADPPVTDTPRGADEYTKPGSPVYLVDVDEKSPEHGKLRGLVPRWWAQAKDEYYTFDDYTLVVQPSEPLLPGTRYLCALTSALKAGDGGSIGRSKDSEELLSGKATGEYADEVAAGLDVLEKSADIERKDIVLATAFTTANVPDEFLATAKRARGLPAPGITTPWEIETPVAAPDTRVRFRAVYDAPEYRKAMPDGKWEIVDGAPTVQKTVGLEVFLAFADATKSGPRPIVIYAHGLGGTKDGCWGTTERLASLGAAVIAIDSPEHGSRSDNPGSPITATFSFFGVEPASGSFDLGRARDNFRQMASDQLELVRLVGSLGSLDLLPVGAPDGVPDLDVSRILYIGHSFGSVQGATVFAVSPEIKQAVWNVGGAGLTTIMRDSGTFSILVNALKPPHTASGALGRFFAIAQGIVDPGDPLNYARYGALAMPDGVPSWTPRDILIQEVIDDNIVPNSTTEALARAAGLTQIDAIRPITGLTQGKSPLSGNLAGGATGALSQFDHMNGMEKAEHGGLIFSDEAIAQYVAFFTSGLANGHANVPPAYPK